MFFKRFKQFCASDFLSKLSANCISIWLHNIYDCIVESTCSKLRTDSSLKTEKNFTFVRLGIIWTIVKSLLCSYNDWREIDKAVDEIQVCLYSTRMMRLLIYFKNLVRSVMKEGRNNNDSEWRIFHMENFPIFHVDIRNRNELRCGCFYLTS